MMDYEEYRGFDLSELQHSIERFERRKKDNKQMEKKYRRNKMTKRNSFRLDHRRKRGWKRNYEPKYEDILFHEEILEDYDKITKTGHYGKILKITHNYLSSLYDERYANNTGVVPKLLSSLGDLPEELLIEILTRLPIKAVVRFKCVSKPWRYLILKFVPVINSLRFLIFSRCETLSFCSIDRDARIETLNSPIVDNLSRDQKVEVHSSCNGLILIQIDSDLFVWNPMTNFFKMVLKIGGFPFPKSNFTFLADLCFCSANNEYKVVMVVHSWSKSSTAQDVYVTSCGVASWKVVENITNSQSMSPGPFFNGYRHWISTDSNSRTQIVYFNPKTNKFIEVESPHRKEEDERDLLTLGVFDGYLCITRSDDLRNIYPINIELLAMKEYGDANSWEVMFVFSNTHYSSIRPLFRTKKGEVLAGTCLDCDCHYSVMAYDAHGSYLREIGAWRMGYDPNIVSFNAILYEESWFSPTAIKVNSY